MTSDKNSTPDYEKTQSLVDQDKFVTMSISDARSFSDNSNNSAQSEILIDGYEILEQLPLGGQAIVYKALQQATKRVVALKVLLKGAMDSSRAQYRFEREVDLAASLKHPNIVTIYDSGIARGQYFFAMEYITGKPLDEYVTAENLSNRQIMELFNKVCSAVAYAHQRGVIHRDLKPGNIMVDGEGEPHILDFGLAKLVEDSEHVTAEKAMVSMPGKVIGTLAFMSPEQASGQPGLVDIRTDVYSIGMILYKVFTGKLPYDISGNMLTVLRNIQEIEPVKPSKSIPRFNSELEAILMKTLAKDVSHRYHSAAHLHQEIDNWLKGLPISAKADNTIYLLKKIIMRHRYTSSVVALLFVIVFGFACSYYQLINKLRQSNQNLESTIKSLNDDNAKFSDLFAQITFRDFLKAVETKQLRLIQHMRRYFKEDSKEMNAAGFLLDPKPLEQKLPRFREKWGKNEPCFVDFIIAEHHLKDNNIDDAIKAYKQCLSHKEYLKKDWLLDLQIKKRLYELTENPSAGKSSQAPEIND